MIALHAIITTYGFWLPNDPRGSWSAYVGNTDLYAFGGSAAKVNTTASVAERRHDSRLRVAATDHLKHRPVRFTGEQARLVATGFESVADESGYSILALAVLPTHIHAIVAASTRRPGHVIGHLKREASDELFTKRQHPCDISGQISHSCWAKQAWKVFIDTEDHLESAIDYVEMNPVKDGLPRQRWSLVKRHRAAWFARLAQPTARQAGRLTIASSNSR